MTERIIDAVAELPKVCEYFNIPVQSGDNAVLERMRRGYDIELYREKVALIRRYMPDAAITTDIIVGFCGETDEEFANTRDLAAEIEFDKVHVAAYSPRPGTIAYRKLEDDVPHETKMARLHTIEQLEAGISARINSRLLGADVEVLVEGRKPNSEGEELWFGRTRQNKLVHFAGLKPGLDGEIVPGALATVRIERTSPWSLAGTAVGPAVPSLP
jgi:tRNA-2-methylthio-N6-dimethylallyladenosine synthase